MICSIKFKDLSFVDMLLKIEETKVSKMFIIWCTDAGVLRFFCTFIG